MCFICNQPDAILCVGCGRGVCVGCTLFIEGRQRRARVCVQCVNQVTEDFLRQRRPPPPGMPTQHVCLPGKHEFVPNQLGREDQHSYQFDSFVDTGRESRRILVNREGRSIHIIEWQLYVIENALGVGVNRLVMLPVAIVNLCKVFLLNNTVISKDDLSNCHAYCGEVMRQVDMHSSQYVIVRQYAPLAAAQSDEVRIQCEFLSAYGGIWGRMQLISAYRAPIEKAIKIFISILIVWRIYSRIKTYTSGETKTFQQTLENLTKFAKIIDLLKQWVSFLSY